MNNWFNIPFKTHLVGLSKESDKTNLPFIVGSLTQQGIEHKERNYNNQDSAGVVFGDDYIFGIICDGCSSTNDDLENYFSNNEIGSRLTTYLLQEIINKRMMTKRKVLNQNTLNIISEELISKLNSLVNRIAKKGCIHRIVFINDLFTTTILGFIITRNSYIIFGIGNGVVILNNQYTYIHSDEYISSYLFNSTDSSNKIRNHNVFKIINVGKTIDLENLLIGSDGFKALFDNNAMKNKFLDFSNIIKVSDKEKLVRNIVRLFRIEYLNDKNVEDFCITKHWPNDDATFILVKKTSITSNE